MAVTLSCSVDYKLAVKVRSLADEGNRSTSDVVLSALSMFVGLPREVRDTLVEMQSHHDASDINRLSREIMAAVSRTRLEIATEQVAGETVFGTADEIDLMEEATLLSEAARQTKPRF